MIVDRGPAHIAKKTRTFGETTEGKAPALLSAALSAGRNPDELVWKHLKTDTVGPMVVISKDAFKRKVRSSMRQPQNHPVKIISFFQKPSFNTPLECSHIYELLNKLEGLTGDKFTRQYESNQVRAHKNAVSLFSVVWEEWR